MGYEHFSTTSKTESDEVTDSSVKNLLPISRECEVTSDGKNECDVPVCENSPIFDDHSEILSNFNDDDISSDDNAFEDIKYVEASPLDPELVSLEGENNERLTSVVMKNTSDNSTNDPLLEEVDLFLASDNSIAPGIENFGYDSKGDIRFLKKLLVDDSIPLPENDSSNFDHQDNSPSFPCPPPEPSDVEFDFEPNSGELISAVMNNIKDECFDSG
uniref:Reverse transcriptase domain-containing protein n=1 Tax=Tanacetum cinerariifolium TaxID=118510 RepID=A0A6L2LBR6_TANCI|nr:hypothetical protein [Tanacetum cinerariifolium]